MLLLFFWLERCVVVNCLNWFNAWVSIRVRFEWFRLNWELIQIVVQTNFELINWMRTTWISHSFATLESLVPVLNSWQKIKAMWHDICVTVCLPLPLSPHPYMVLPVSQSLLVQSVSALCLDYVPGVSSYVSLYKSVLPHVTGGLLLMSARKPVSMFVPVFLCLLSRCCTRGSRYEETRI